MKTWSEGTRDRTTMPASSSTNDCSRHKSCFSGTHQHLRTRPVSRNSDPAVMLKSGTRCGNTCGHSSGGTRGTLPLHNHHAPRAVTLKRQVGFSVPPPRHPTIRVRGMCPRWFPTVATLLLLLLLGDGRHKPTCTNPYPHWHRSCWWVTDAWVVLVRH